MFSSASGLWERSKFLADGEQSVANENVTFSRQMPLFRFCILLPMIIMPSALISVLSSLQATCLVERY